MDSDPTCGPAGGGRTLAGNCTATIAVIPSKTQAGGLNRFTVSMCVCVYVCVCMYVYQTIHIHM